MNSLEAIQYTAGERLSTVSFLLKAQFNGYKHRIEGVGDTGVWGGQRNWLIRKRKNKDSEEGCVSVYSMCMPLQYDKSAINKKV